MRADPWFCFSTLGEKLWPCMLSKRQRSMAHLAAQHTLGAQRLLLRGRCIDRECARRPRRRYMISTPCRDKCCNTYPRHELRGGLHLYVDQPRSVHHANVKGITRRSVATALPARNIKKSLSRMMSFDRPTAMRNGAFWKGCSVQLPMLLTSMAPKAASMPRPCKTPSEHNSGTKMPTGRHAFVMSISGSAARKTAPCRSAGPSTRRTSERAFFRTASPMAGALDSKGARAMKLATKIKIKKFSCRSASKGIGPNPGPKRNSTATRPTVIGRTP
mmetsp:Transcript_60254/g.153008  ORF Transcript_60254/g.153008 Transcript_60254/m.153008 type:complete len:274 (-) Transcript_60254:492-1313(-)